MSTFNPVHPAAPHGNFQNPICAAELELSEIVVGLEISPVQERRV